MALKHRLDYSDALSAPSSLVHGLAVARCTLGFASVRGGGLGDCAAARWGEGALPSRTGVLHYQGSASPQDPTVGLCLGS